MYVFTPKCGIPICHVLLTVQNTHRRALFSSSTTDNLLDLYRNKTKQHLQTQIYCHLLGLDEKSRVAYNLGETQTLQTCNYFSFSLFGREDHREILASV